MNDYKPTIVANCPYCGELLNVERQSFDTLFTSCPECGKRLLFDVDGRGNWGLWRFECCERCRRNRLNKDGYGWHCLDGGCEKVTP